MPPATYDSEAFDGTESAEWQAHEDSARDPSPSPPPVIRCHAPPRTFLGPPPSSPPPPLRVATTPLRRLLPGAAVRGCRALHGRPRERRVRPARDPLRGRYRNRRGGGDAPARARFAPGFPPGAVRADGAGRRTQR